MQNNLENDSNLTLDQVRDFESNKPEENNGAPTSPTSNLGDFLPKEVMKFAVTGTGSTTGGKSEMNLPGNGETNNNAASQSNQNAINMPSSPGNNGNTTQGGASAANNAEGSASPTVPR